MYIDLSKPNSLYFPVSHENASPVDDTATARLSLNDTSMMSFKHLSLVGVSIDVVLHPRPSVPSFDVPNTYTSPDMFLPMLIFLLRKIFLNFIL